MTGFLLDTNILSNLIKPAPSPALLAWMSEQSDEQLFISEPALFVASCLAFCGWLVLVRSAHRFVGALPMWFLRVDVSGGALRGRGR